MIIFPFFQKFICTRRGQSCSIINNFQEMKYIHNYFQMEILVVLIDWIHCRITLSSKLLFCLAYCDFLNPIVAIQKFNVTRKRILMSWNHLIRIQMCAIVTFYHICRWNYVIMVRPSLV